jgi:riboflavin kinase/FMN adenylyltransferase
MLGRHYSFAGVVVSGQKKGALLGFPTANIEPPAGFMLAHCVYASIARIGKNDYLSATSVGTRPTMTTDKKVVVETYVLEQNFNLYGREIRIFFIEMVRHEKKFASIDELKKHIAEDCERIRELARVNPTHFRIKD